MLDHFSARFPKQAVSVIVGDEKSGKLTALKVIAGTEKIDAGDVIIDGRSMLETPAGERAVAMVLGADSLMPHKSAADNIAFPLRMAGLSKADMAARVEQAVERFGLRACQSKKPKRLGPDERLRTSYARAFARRPRAYLVSQTGLDEAAVARACLPILLEEGASVIVATADPSDLLHRADWFCFIRQGRAVQRGARDGVMAHPRTLQIAKHLGLRLLEGTVTGAKDVSVTVRTAEGGELDIPVQDAPDLVGERITLALPQKGDLSEAVLFDEAGKALARP